MLVKGTYERMVGNACALRVLSESPRRAKPLVVSRAKTAALLPVPPDELNLTTEIIKTLSFLTS